MSRRRDRKEAEDVENPELGRDLSLEDLANNMDSGVAIYDARGNFVFVNNVLINWRSIPRSEFLRKNVHDFYPYIDICVFDLVCQKKQRVSRLQYYRDTRMVNGPTRMRIVTGTPVFDGEGEIRYVVTVLQDVQSFQDLCTTLLKETEVLHESPQDSAPGNRQEEGIVACSQEFLHLLSVAESVAPLDSSVLIQGESGTGKEVIARYIHSHSGRKDKPLITVNCAAFPESLIESELFGYEKGSFTGASRTGKQGLIESADGGTLFLDEINSLPLSVQGKLLRVIEEKQVQRIGAVRSRKVDFRLLAATNRDLGRLVQSGQFREDLYYRLYVIPLTVPPVRSRRDDIVPLCLHFLDSFCRKYCLKKSFSQEVLDQVLAYDWPGNVREIRNFVERMVVMTPASTVEIRSIPAGLLGGGTEPFQASPSPAGPESPPPPSRRSGALGREEVLSALSRCGGSRTKAAQELGISRRYLQYKLREYGVPYRYQRDGGTAEKNEK